MEGQVNRHLLIDGPLSVVIAKSGGASPVVRPNAPPRQLLPFYRVCQLNSSDSMVSARSRRMHGVIWL
jgi:hypothetical protein